MGSRLWQAVQPYAKEAAYLNYVDAGAEGADQVRAAYGGNYERLSRRLRSTMVRSAS